MDDTLIRLGLVDEDDIVLDEAALSLALVDNPGTDLQPYHVLLDAIATRLDAASGDATTAIVRADALAQVIGGEFGFVGDRETYDQPANADLIRVLDRRRGLPVSLSILYVAAARRLGWSADVLDIPGHVLVVIGQEIAPVIIDPFRGGGVVQPQELIALLSATVDGSPAVRHVAAMSNRAILVRLLMNQATRAEQAGKGRRALELYRRMNAVAPDYGQAWWERARLELVDGEVAEARASLTAMLEITREPALRATILEMMEALVAH